MFTNREEAGYLLADKLINYSNNKNEVIVTIPRGGVPIGYIIAKKLQLPLELVLSKKIGHPINKEYAIGAVTLTNSIINEGILGVSETYIKEETEQIRAVLKQRYKWYYGTKKPLNLANKIVIIVDDGVATGSTLLSSIKLIQLQQPSEIIVALPVASPSALKKIKDVPIVTNTICLHVPKYFQAVGQFYNEFDQVNDKEVLQLLKAANDAYLHNYSDV